MVVVQPNYPRYSALQIAVAESLPKLEARQYATRRAAGADAAAERHPLQAIDPKATTVARGFKNFAIVTRVRIRHRPRHADPVAYFAQSFRHRHPFATQELVELLRCVVPDSRGDFQFAYLRIGHDLVQPRRKELPLIGGDVRGGDGHGCCSRGE